MKVVGERQKCCGEGALLSTTQVAVVTARSSRPGLVTKKSDVGAEARVPNSNDNRNRRRKESDGLGDVAVKRRRGGRGCTALSTLGRERARVEGCVFGWRCAYRVCAFRAAASQLRVGVPASRQRAREESVVRGVSGACGRVFRNRAGGSVCE